MQDTRMIGKILVAASLVFSSAASAQSKPQGPSVPTRVTAEALSRLCAQDRSACLGYVIGATDAWAGALVAAGRPQAFCVPAGTTNNQIAEAAVAFVRAHPEEAANNAGIVVFNALITSYPCKR